MDMGDIFRRLFGFRSPYTYRDRFLVEDDDNNNNDDDEHFHESNKPNDKNDNQEGISPRNGLEDMFEHFHSDMKRQMDAIHKQMEDMTRGFGVVDFSSVFQGPTFRAPLQEDGKTGERKRFRDFMLKEDNFEQIPSKKQNTPIIILPHEDSDLDGKISEDKLIDLIQKPKPTEPCHPNQPHQNEPSFFSSSSKSSSFSSFRGPDGRVEEKRTVRDSSVHEESTVTMKLGDKSYTVTEVTLPDGKREKKETYNNIDARDVGKFLDSWKNTPPQPPLADLDPRDTDLFSKFFGRKF